MSKLHLAYPEAQSAHVNPKKMLRRLWHAIVSDVRHTKNISQVRLLKLGGEASGLVQLFQRWHRQSRFSRQKVDTGRMSPA
eukprot:CAMPEP_0172767752 /NCGR_PEP_ID=MMETSP1074-20121228/183469_1 /TAXON_ID=2916 /ORGANISM="Ceratium fusus, Strain PA161109" /LENGTH=80 /DNA_ID=CAMNT_0013603041 /DNA_START=70 /DNA_END=313 /DNA_ORIENTATION=-